MSVTTNAFYREKECSALDGIYKLSDTDSKRSFRLCEAIQTLTRMIGKNTKSEIMAEVKNCINYPADAFAFDWLKAGKETNDAFAFERFLTWFYENRFEVVNTMVSCTCAGLTTMAHIVCRQEGIYYAFHIVWRESRYSKAGRKEITNLYGSLDLLLMKQVLEETYPGIMTGIVSLTSQADSDWQMAPSFNVSDNKKSNLYCCDMLSEFGVYNCRKQKIRLKKGEEAPQAAFTEVREMIDRMVNAEYPHKNCTMCHYKEICNETEYKKIADVEAGVEAEKPYALPKYSEEQLRAVRHKDGPLQICAGPGSGKTAVLTGRCVALQKAGVDMRNLLLITFTNKAADELKKRLGYVIEGEMPTVMTLNGLGNSILTDNRKLFPIPPKTATDIDYQGLLRGVLSGMPRIGGVSYSNLYGSLGTLRTLLRWFEECNAEGAAMFGQIHTDIDMQAFMDAKSQYEGIVLEKGWISFDQQISMAISFLTEHPDILSMYRNIYRYIMVDEFQDMDADQFELVSMLAAPVNNLAVVGDDDQGIYGFRGGDIRYMVRFTDWYPDAEVVTLSKNYRSERPIIALAGAMISRNTERIPKDIVATKQSDDTKPLLLKEMSLSRLDTLVRDICKEGYGYGDIAILARTNSVLSDMKRQCHFPSKVSKTYLRDDAVFVSTCLLLKIWFTKNSKTIARLANRIDGSLKALIVECDNIDELIGEVLEGHTIFEYAFLEKLKAEGHEDSVNHLIVVLKKISSLLQTCEEMEKNDTVDIEAFMLSVAETFFGVSGKHVAVETVVEQAGHRKIETLYGLYQWMTDIILFEDDARVDYFLKESCVELLTCHDSKGKEFPVVILWDAEKIKTDPESLRLAYVAVTRAEKELYICSSSAQQPKILETCEGLYDEGVFEEGGD